MNVVDGGSLLAMIAFWSFVAIALAVAGSYFLRPRTRSLYPGGPRRYLLALVVQAVGFLLPIPLVLIVLTGSVPQGSEVFIAVAVGLAVVFVLRNLPVTGPLLKDLHRARVEAVLQRLGPKP